MSAGPKRILAVGVGESQKLLFNVTNASSQPPLRHAIIYGLADALQRTYGHAPGSFVIDYVEADVRPGEGTWDKPQTALKKAIMAYANKQGHPDLVFPIASTATWAAQETFGKQAGNTPIVFVVVSDPMAEEVVEYLTAPGGNTTGVSTCHRQMAATAVGKFLKVFKDHNQPLGTICWMHRKNFPPSHNAYAHILHTLKSNNIARDHRLVKDRKHVSNLLAGNTVASQAGMAFPTVGLFVAPDDMVVSHWQTVISRAQDGKKIPTFFQVLEFARADPNDPNKPCALGAYGIPGNTVGVEAAELVHKILWQNKAPGDLEVKVLDDEKRYFQLWWNNDVARALRAPRLTATEADQIFGSPTP